MSISIGSIIGMAVKRQLKTLGRRQTQLALKVEEIDEEPFVLNRLPVVSMDLLLAMSSDFLSSEKHVTQQWRRFHDLNKFLGGFR